MLQFSYSVNTEQVERTLTRLQELLVDQSPALARIADDFREMVTQQFATEGRAGGAPWAELAPSTLRRRRGASGILQVTGTLLGSLRDAGAAGHVEETDAQSLTLGSRLAYALYHQTGTGRGFGQTQVPSGVPHGRGMPMRPVLVLTPARAERWAEIVRRHLEEKTLLLGAKELGARGGQQQ